MAIDLELVHTGVRKTRNTSILVAVLTLALGGGMVAGAIAGSDQRVALAVIGGIFLAVALFMLRWAGTMWDPRRAPVARLVGERPGEIRWIYVEQINSQVGGATVKKSHAVKVADAAGKLHTIMIPTKHLDPLLAQLRAAAPAALYGYDQETIAAYKAQAARDRAQPRA